MTQEHLECRGQTTPPNDTNMYPSKQAQLLLGAYPFASANPSTHSKSQLYRSFRLTALLKLYIVARHLSNLSLAPAPPSYIDSSYYTTPTSYGNTTQYDAEVSQLLAMKGPPAGAERDFWEASRDELVQSLGDQSAARYVTKHKP